jgi:hypothetical protein
LRANAALVAAVAFSTLATADALAGAEQGETRGISKTVSRAALPGGLVLTVEPGAIAVERGGVRVPLAPLGRGVVPRALKGVDMDDGGNVIATITDACDDDHKVSLTLADLDARLDRVAAPATAAAQLKAGKPADAAHTLAPVLARAPLAVYAQVASNPTLAPLLRQPDLSALRASPPGTARLTVTKSDVSLGKARGSGNALALAVSNRHKLIGVVDTQWSWGSCVGEGDLVLLDLAGAEVARLPLFSAPDMSTDEEKHCPFTRPGRARVTAQVKAAQRVLADLGFAAATGEPGEVSTAASNRPRALFPKAKLGVVLGNDQLRALRGDEELGRAPAPKAEQINAATHLPDQNVIVLRWGRGGREGCEAVDPQGVVVLPLQPSKSLVH